MAAFEVIYVLAATLWILTVVAALCIGVRFMAEFRRRQRRMNRLLDVVRVPIRLGGRAVWFLRWCECVGRPYSVAACQKAARRLQGLISEFRPGGHVALPSANRRR